MTAPIGTVITIDDCDPCILRDGQRCYHPDHPRGVLGAHAGRRIDSNGGQSPTWCPLRTGPVVLRLRGGS